MDESLQHVVNFIVGFMILCSVGSVAGIIVAIVLQLGGDRD